MMLSPPLLIWTTATHTRPAQSMLGILSSPSPTSEGKWVRMTFNLQGPIFPFFFNCSDHSVAETARCYGSHPSFREQGGKTPFVSRCCLFYDRISVLCLQDRTYVVGKVVQASSNCHKNPFFSSSAYLLWNAFPVTPLSMSYQGKVDLKLEGSL